MHVIFQPGRPCARYLPANPSQAASAAGSRAPPAVRRGHCSAVGPSRAELCPPDGALPSPPHEAVGLDRVTSANIDAVTGGGAARRWRCPAVCSGPAGTLRAWPAGWRAIRAVPCPEHPSLAAASATLFARHSAHALLSCSAACPPPTRSHARP